MILINNIINEMSELITEKQNDFNYPLENPSNYFPWHDLSDEEKKAIHDKHDFSLISIIDGILDKDRNEIYKNIKIKEDFFHHYMTEEREWIEDCAWYLGQKKESDIKNNPEFYEEIIKNAERFRLYFAVKYYSEIHIEEQNRKVIDFLIQVKRGMILHILKNRIKEMTK